MKSVQRCIALAQLLVEQNFPAIAIHRGMPQEERWVLGQVDTQKPPALTSLFPAAGASSVQLRR